MKNLNLIKRLWKTDSHEKQSPQRFARYAVMLMMLLTLGVGQMWGTDAYVKGYSSWDATAANKMTGTSSPWTFTARWASAGEFKIYIGSTWYGGSITGFSKEDEITTSGGNMTFTSVPADGGIYTITVKLKNTKYYITVDKVVEEGSTAYSISSSPYIYFNVAAASSTYTAASILLGKSDGSQDYAMSGKISGTQLFYKQMPNWSNYKTFLFIDANNWGGKWNTQKVTERIGGATNTNTYNTGMSGNYHMFTVASGDDNAALSYTSQTTYGALLNKTQTVQVRVSEDNGANYSNAAFASWPGTINVARTYMSSATASSSPDATAMTAATTDAAITSSITFTGASTTEYTFAGWSNSSTGPDGNTSKTYTITDAATKYAFYKRKQYTVSYGVNSSTRYGSITLNSGSAVTTTSSSTLNHGTSISFTASANSGYQVEGWYSDASCTVGNRLQSGGNSYDAGTLTAATTVYVKFEEKTGGIITLSAGANGQVSADNSSWGSTKYISDITTATDVNIYAKGNTGYQFSSWTKSSGSGTIKTNAASGVFTTVAYKDATVTASFTEKMTTVTVNVSPTGAGTLTVGGDAFTPGNTTTAGVATSRTVVATAANDYTFDSWSVTDNATGTSSTNTYTLKGNGSAGTGTLTANFTPVPCSLMYGNSTPLNSPTSTAMSYDATEHAYYKEITTTSSPFYFRFSHDDGKQYSGDWNTYPDVNEVTANGSKVPCSTETQGWGNKASVKYIGESGTTIRIWFDYQNKKTWITADKDKQYVLRGATAGDSDVPGGMPGWGATTSYFDGLASGNTGTVSCSLNAGEWYHLKVYDMYTKTWYGNTTGDDAVELTDGVLSTMGTKGNFYFGATIADSYTFTLDKSSGMKIKVDYPVSYKVELEVGTVKGNARTPKIYLGSTSSESNVISSGSYVAAGSKVIFWIANDAGSAPAAGYNWWGFYDNAAGDDPTKYTHNDVSIYTINSIAADAHVYAVFGENDYTVKMYNNGNGDVYEGGSIVTSTTAHVATASNTLTATPQTGYYFTGWDQFADSLTINSPSTASTTIKIKSNKLGNNARLRANYSPQWSVIGTGAFGGWSAYGSHLFTGYAVVSTKNVGYHSITLAANTSYEIKVYDRQNSTAYGGSAAQTIDYAHSGAGNQYTVATTASPKNVVIQSAAGGTYTLNWNLTDKKIAVVYPTSWFITSGQKTTGQADNAGGSFTAVDNSSNDVKGGKFVANNATVTFTATPNTGYNFVGWYSDASCETAYVNGTGGAAISGVGGVVLTLSSITADKTVYAKFTPKTYTVTLSQTGAASAGTANVTATYNAATPSIASLPTAANGYAFMGYYNATGGKGSQFVNASGTWATSVPDTIADGKWVLDAGATLYAYFKKAEITEITLNATAFEPVEAGKTGYVVANPTIAPTPTGTTSICWELLYDNDNPVPGHDAMDDHDGSHPDRVKFSIAGLAAGGYKVRATLKGEGGCGSGTTLSVQEASFTIASNFTVTILYKCGDFSLKASTSVSGKPLDWSEDITAPDITGYTFARWDAGDGITIKNGDSDPVTTSTDATIKIKANYDGNLTAVYTKKDIIYFYNTLGWEHVYVYFYSSGAYWDNSNGTGANYTKEISSTKAHWRHFWGEMTPTGDENIYYFDYQEAAKTIDPTYWSEINGYTNVAFTKDPQGFGYGADGDDADKIGDGYEWFYNTDVVRRSDFSHSLPMFVPLSSQTKVTKNSNADYYNEGYWMNYPENTGYTLRIYSTPGANNATGASREYMIPYSSDKRMPLKQDVEINFSGETWFLIYRNDGKYLQGSAGHDTFKQSDHDDEAVSSTSDAGSAYKLKVISDAEGIYTFNLSYHGNGANPEVYSYYINVDFPAAVGDYRIVYKDNAEWSQGSAHTSSWYHPSKVIPKIKGDATEAKKDTVSFFVAKGDGITATMKFQKIDAIAADGTVTWADVASGSITIPSSITTSGVYNFIVTQPVGGGSISVESAEPYTGNYYIRTDNAGDTKWNNYRSRDHQMVYTEFSRNRATNTFGELYTHYFTSWCERKTNIKFCIANDYSPCISDTLGQDVGNPYSNTDTGGNLNTDGATLPINDKYSANVRFMYNETTNKICRAYIGSSTNPARKFLMLEGNQVLKGDDDEAISDWAPRYALILADKQNWIYEHVLKIKPKTRFKLYACYAQTTVSPDGAQYFRGAYDSNNFTTDANSVILIDGAGDADYQMARIIYDFKTNRLMTAWIPSGSDVTGNMEINADVLVEREHQEPAQYITFANASSQLSGVKTVYGAMKFNRWILNNRGGSSDDDPDHARTTSDLATYHAPLPVGQQKSIYERSLYFISFPFDVNANEIFGFGHYWDEWYLEYYDGLTRAKNGYWEDSPPNWKYVTPSMLNDFVLKANEGYILGLDLDFMKADNFDFWSNGISTVELFFPSTTTQGTLQQTNCTIPALSAIEGDPYRCTINRGTTEGNRTIKDSYWRCLGVPSFNIYNTSLTDGSGNPITWQPDGNTLPFIYAWNKADNTLTAQSTSTFTFLPMHAYLVQNGGEIRWTNVSAKPASPIVARRVNEQPATEYEWRLALTSDSVLIDQTYVKMSNIEQVTDTFDFNQDMIKEFNAYRSDIYTYIGYERVAANSMPLQTEQTTVIPVGVKIKDAGDYTFAMPDGTNGVGVTLIDTQTGVRTNLGLMDYTVTLTAGSFNQRFVLEISPIMQTPTDIEEVTGDGVQVTGVRKVLIDQKMYIIRDGKVYDARGAKVK